MRPTHDFVWQSAPSEPGHADGQAIVCIAAGDFFDILTDGWRRSVLVEF
jgi:hypothetical protein